MGSFSIWHWAIVLLAIMLVFGTKKLSSISSDLGMAVKGFKDGVKGDDEKPAQGTVLVPAKSVDSLTIDVEAKREDQELSGGMCLRRSRIAHT